MKRPFILCSAGLAFLAHADVLRPEAFKHYVDGFNAADRELYTQSIPNSAAWAFLAQNIPLFECPEPSLERTYYFRWWTYRKHLCKTSDGWVVTEFLPKVPWSGKHNTISCPAGHHLYEGRWLRDPSLMRDYCRFWFKGGGEPRRYSFWAADAVWARHLVSPDEALLKELLPDLIENWKSWQRGHEDPNGLYWQSDDRDGMECSIGGSGYRVTLNSYQFADALAIAAIAERAGDAEAAQQFRAAAAQIKQRVEAHLWDADAAFFKVLPRDAQARAPSAPLADVRELHGYVPWCFNLPGADKSAAWRQLIDPQGFCAPYGPTTVEQRHPKFAYAYKGHECQWNGSSWPFATAQTLTALANLLNNYQQPGLGKRDYYEALLTYAQSHRRALPDGREVPWIDENLNPYTGDWTSRTMLSKWKGGTWSADKGGEERGKDYNHSTFTDLIITGLVGLRPRPDGTLEVNPLVPEGKWGYFCLDAIRYRGVPLTILWDITGERYGKGKGLSVFSGDRLLAHSGQLARLTAPLPPPTPAPPPTQVPPASKWAKYEGNPVLGGKHGTCFDIAVLREDPGYRMWVSWRPKKSLALVESKDGLTWSDPPVVVFPPRPETGWEDDINRPIVLKKDGLYHLWYTGQAKGRSAIGYATSPDGTRWTRHSDKPVLTADQPWEKVAVMCPHVNWDTDDSLFKMWYSAGDQYEPDAIGYATSPDGVTWAKHAQNPVFRADPANAWEKHKVTAAQVIKRPDGYLIFYIGFEDEHHAQIGMATSADGIRWTRHAHNPIVPTTPKNAPNDWDADACYKPYAIFDGERWLLWYNGRKGGLEQIGVVLHDGDL